MRSLRLIFLVFFLNQGQAACQELASGDYLSLGDEALSTGIEDRAIEFYRKGISALKEDASLLTKISLSTNLATALGNTEEAVKLYQEAISIFSLGISDIVDKDGTKQATDAASQASFFLGMVLQDLGEARKSTDAYGYAVLLDPYHWGALANLGSVLHDELSLHDEALQAYNKAFEILTQTEIEPTDPPADPRYVISQLQYRIGLCLSHDLNRKCAVKDDPNTPVSCIEMATHAFSLAVQYDPDNESAKHMLATTTADATMKRASNVYIKSLFDDYASK